MTDVLLVHGGTVVVPGPNGPEGLEADVLVQDGVITAVEPRGALDPATTDALAVDAGGTLVIPGFIDTHRHTWETALRGALPACSLNEYLRSIVGVYGSRFRPEDVYAATVWGALEALNAGITTMLDWAHCNTGPEHADAGVEALRAVGIRGVYAHGTPSGVEYWIGSALHHPDDARRVKEEHFSSDDDLLTFAMALRGAEHVEPGVLSDDWALARELDARITVHAGMRITGNHVRTVTELDRVGLLGPDTTYVHLTTSSDRELSLVADSGGTVSVAPYVEMVMGHGPPPVVRLQERGLDPSFSIDVATTVPGDMFTQMRTALAQGRLSELSDDPDVDFAPALDHRDVFRFATAAGAEACGLGSRTGTITPGKAADLVLVRADAVNTYPMIDPIAAVVSCADVSNVDTVIVGGRIRKRHGVLTDVDLPALRARVGAARDHVLHTGGSDAPQPAAEHTRV